MEIVNFSFSRDESERGEREREKERGRRENTRRRVFWKNVTRDSNHAGETGDVTSAALVE